MSLVVPVTVELEQTKYVQSRRGSSKPITESQFATKMYLYGREICFLLAIIFTSYAALQNGSPKVAKTPAAVPFFSRTSLVTDFYHGQLSSAFERVSESDVSFVMYYAPWDAESQALRSHFKAVAQYYYKQVYFAAINCWQPLSECRQQFSKIQMFPVLIAYTQHTKGIQYKGIKEATHMIGFLNHLLKPVDRVHHTSDLVHLMSRYDAVVVGFFNFAGNVGGPGYHTFYSTALKFLERDPQREVGFGVVTDGDTALKSGVYDTPAVRLYMWNETLEYSQTDEYTPDALSKWISDKTHQVAVWVSPPGVKSLTLSPYVDEGSVLVLFTPRNPLLKHDHNYELLREVGLEYYNCDNNPWVNDLTRWLGELRTENKAEQLTQEQVCVSQADELIEPLVSTVHVVADRWSNVSCRRKRPTSPVQEVCYGPLMRQEAEENNNSKSLKGSFMLADDSLSASALLVAEQHEQCRMLRRAAQLHRPVFPYTSAEPHSATSLKGLVCRTNRTLSLLAMDSLQFGHFAAALGVDVMAKPDHTAVVIFNAYDESSYSLKDELSKASLTDFITGYAEGRVHRTLRSAAPSTTQCHHVRHKACVPEVTSATFNEVVMDNHQSVVLLYHTPFCAFCGSISHSFLTAARHFRAVSNLTFARIDGENNDLPWEYTMHHYPTILYFPAKRKSESRVYPHHLPITVPNLVSFVLANLGPGYDQLQGLIGLCSVLGRNEDCILQMRRECLQAISDTLSDYRSAMFRWRVAQTSAISKRALASYHQLLIRESRHLLFKLQHLKEVQLLLTSTDLLSEGSREFVAIQKSFQLYQSLLADRIVNTTTSHDERPIKDEL